jgi:hypothetical protein
VDLSNSNIFSSCAAVFGRLDGLYTRQMLLKTLGEQKLFCNSMQKLMGDQTMELEECRVTVVQASGAVPHTH